MENGNGLILCVDDNLDTCLMMTTLLGAGGYSVRYALSAGEGLDLARRSNFDLIILDWVLADGTGTDLCRRIRSFDSRTPIVFLSGRSYPSDKTQALNAGAQGFLMKPFGIDELLKVVSKLVARGPQPPAPS